MKLVEVFASLPRPSAVGSYSVEQVRSNCRIGRTFDGHPAFLVSLDTGDGSKLPRRLANFAYHPPAAVEIRSGTHVQSTQLAIVECCTTERRLAEYFFRIVAEVLIPEAESGDEVRFERAIDAVITLFKALQRPATRTIQGLWAELAMIELASNTDVTVTSWHSGARALHDFVNGGARLEVKSTTKGLREHSFLLDQLRLVDDGHVLVASLQLLETSDGISVFALVDLIRPKLATPDTRQRLETIVAECLGNAYEAVEEHLYDLEAARTSLRLYRAEEIPTCLLPLPPEVKEVSFTVDLSTTKPLSVENARNISAPFRDLLPLA